MTTYTTAWRHVSFPTNEHGVIWIGAGTPDAGDHMVGAGGFAEALTNANENSTDIAGDAISGMVTVAGTRAWYNSGSDITHWAVAFAAPPGTWLRCHVFGITASETP